MITVMKRGIVRIFGGPTRGLLLALARFGGASWRAACTLWRRTRRQLFWVPIAAFVAFDGLPSADWHPPLAVAAVLLGAVWSRFQAARDRRRAARHLSAAIVHLRQEAAIYKFDATTDRLTAVANRPAFYKALALAMDDCRANPTVRGPALLMIDVDRFKETNDTFGHHVGDMTLIHLARVLRRETRATDVVGRLGGDEFAVLARDADADTVRRLVTRITSAAAARPVYRNDVGQEVRLCLSVGTALLIDHDDIDSALIAADRALYAAKQIAHDQAA